MNRIEYNAIYDSVCIALTLLEQESDVAADYAHVALMDVAKMLDHAEIDEVDRDVVITTR